MLRLVGFYLTGVVLSGFIACSGTNNVNSREITKFPEGRNLYVSKCTACHKAYERELHSSAEWDKILNDMGKKAKLSSDEKARILNYLSERNQ